MRPHKINGLTDTQRTRMCSGKNRWADELSAVAGAIHSLERHKDSPELYVYHCPECKGWHLTKRPQAGQQPITLARFEGDHAE